MGKLGLDQPAAQRTAIIGVRAKIPRAINLYTDLKYQLENGKPGEDLLWRQL